MNLNKYINMLICYTGVRLTTQTWFDEEKGLRNAYTISTKGSKPIKCYSKTKVLQELMSIKDGE